MKRLLLFIILIFTIFACKQAPNTDVPREDVNYDKAVSFFNKDNDSAFYYFSTMATASEDSLDIAIAYTYMAVIQNSAGDYFGSIESSLTALTYLDENKAAHVDCFSSNYNELGLNNLHLENYEVALRYYDLALKYADKDASRLIMLNNQALAYQKIEEFDKALHIYSQIVSDNTANQKEYARVLSNIAKTKWLQNPRYHAVPDFLKALSIREKENDLWGQNASYAHLADYYANSKPDSGLLYAHSMYGIAKKLNSPDDQIEALQKLIRLSPSESTKHFFEIYQQLNDSVQLARSAAKNQFALIRYETEKHKADNLELQQDNTRKRYQIIKQRIVLFSTLLIVLVGSIISLVWYKKRKQHLALAAENTIRENRLKTSKKVHDVVANGLYRVMSEIENQPAIDREGVLGRLEQMYEKSRDISYEAESLPNKQQNFNEKIANLLRSFATESTKIIIAGNEASLWQKINEQTKYELEHILQEFMVNMRKHSRATNVLVRFEQQANDIHVYYTDNGVGMPAGLLYRNGLTNTGNRIKSLHGEIIFDTKVERGLKIHFSFPIS
ncbi:ATP-binding protein [Olivibacter sp. SDN3]|uniref:tetratricopeptide repeat-containing sensor histidine kinase n=1 Tax=Olivibacter sp. SDN3 TaxID=2764720 RepID=UPI0016514542|nr:tetratricopeptide repeat-containing sensor histidine kinase [Olivibacter sp. SDN3]QNL51898.1 ATP-binding protein [Olivibacter sp. SDN3]